MIVILFVILISRVLRRSGISSASSMSLITRKNGNGLGSRAGIEFEKMINGLVKPSVQKSRISLGTNHRRLAPLFLSNSNTAPQFFLRDEDHAILQSRFYRLPPLGQMKSMCRVQEEQRSDSLVQIIASSAKLVQLAELVQQVVRGKGGYGGGQGKVSEPELLRGVVFAFVVGSTSGNSWILGGTVVGSEVVDVDVVIGFFFLGKNYF
mmetsp:Transcript_22743/g.46795  ORF Transcript_22743/g.46795 Transcript_22743/m.46795 type:complete len:208 (-) Transcript_22743:96-719(-)